MLTEKQEHKPIGFPEAFKMKGDAWSLASQAIAKRSRADELLAEVNQLVADAEALERSARLVQREAEEAGDGWCYDMSKAPSGLVDLWDGEEVVVGFYVKGPDRSGWFFWDGECVWLEAVGDDFAELSAWKDGEGPVAWRFRPTPPKKARKEFDNDR